MIIVATPHNETRNVCWRWRRRGKDKWCGGFELGDGGEGADTSGRRNGGVLLFRVIAKYHTVVHCWEACGGNRHNRGNIGMTHDTFDCLNIAGKDGIHGELKGWRGRGERIVVIRRPKNMKQVPIPT